MSVFVICTEDRDDSVMKALVKKLARRIEPSCQTHRLDLRSVGGEPRVALRGGHRWRGDEALRRALINDLARRIKLGEWVVFHHDADVPWALGAKPKYSADVAKLFLDIGRRLGAEGEPMRLEMIPFYSVESWLYLNRRCVRRLVEQGKPLKKALAWLDANLDPGIGFDHVINPKDQCPLEAGWNLDLVETWSASDATRQSPSWAAVEREWSANEALCAALSQTGQPQP